jgi:hypothetical protein
MTRLQDQLEEDRALRNSARALFRKELSHVRREVTPQALGERAADRVGAKVDAASDDAVSFLRDHGGKIAAATGTVAAGVGLWLGRKPIIERLRSLFDGSGEADNATDGGTDKETDDE